MIDFGISSKYLDSQGVHLGENEPELRAGSVLFASLNMFKRIKLSRRDDLISLVYLLVFFLTGDLAFLELKNRKELKKPLDLEIKEAIC